MFTHFIKGLDLYKSNEAGLTVSEFEKKATRIVSDDQGCDTISIAVGVILSEEHTNT